MGVIDKIHAKAKANRRHVVLPEGSDPRIIEGSVRAARDGLARVTLLTSEKVDGVECIDPANSDKLDAYSAAFFELRKHKGITEEQAAKTMRDPLAFAAMMVRLGDADATLGGAAHTTGDILRAALQIIGPAQGVKTVSSFFLMVMNEPHHNPHQTVVFSDCGLIIEPTSEQLADIAVASATSFKALVGEEPKVAMLSFSTMGSAKHESVDVVAKASELAKMQAPDLKIDGEMQFDAAFVPSVGASKAPGSETAGQANVFVFPNLAAGNIGYKIAQRIGGAKALGPVLQGLAKPANDLSRGCSADDVYNMIGVSAAQVE